MQRPSPSRLSLALACFVLFAPGAALAERAAVTAARLLDVDSGQLRSNAVVIVEVHAHRAR